MACNAPSTPNTAPPRMTRIAMIDDRVFGLISDSLRELFIWSDGRGSRTRYLWNPPGLVTSGSGSSAKHCFYKLPGARRASYTHDYRLHICAGGQLECQEATTLPLCRNQFLHGRN